MNAEGRQIARRKRITGVALFSMAALVGLGLRVGYLTVVDQAKLAQRAQSQYRLTIRSPAPRGAIFARTGEILAETVSAPTVFAGPLYHEVPPERRQAIADTLGVDRAILDRRLDSKKGFVYLGRRVSRAAANQVMEMGLDGVGLMEEARRLYPHGQLAAHVIGTANSELQGLEGIELRYDRWMRAPELVWTVERDGKSRTRFVRGTVPEARDPAEAPAASLELTIDPYIQAIVERELALGVEEFDADAGTVVVLDPWTGAIVAMANYPTYDPNHAGLAEADQRRNRAVTDIFEPGSTFKAFLAAAAVDSGTIGLDETVDCEEGRYRIGRRTIHDTHKYSLLTLPEVIQYSSNIGTSKIAEMLGRDAFAHYLHGFGFGRRTSVDLPGEVSGIMNAVSRWGPIELATTSFGQGIAVTPIQLAAAFAAIANGGILHRPHVLASATAENGKQLYKWQAETAQSSRAIRPRTAELVTAMLESVVDAEGGTGRNARIAGVRVAGKTGTAQKARTDGRGYSRERVASFVGFAPADDPALVTLVVIDNPKKATYGGTVAAPIFQKVMERALDRVGRRRAPVTEDSPTRRAVLAVERMPEALESLVEGAAPSLVGLSLRRALARANQAGIPVQIEGSGFVVEQLPIAGTPLAGAPLHLRLEPAAGI
ncbi:MAG: penicillin-binding protein [Deltaproteobacteria bacterium]